MEREREREREREKEKKRGERERVGARESLFCITRVPCLGLQSEQLVAASRRQYRRRHSSLIFQTFPERILSI